MTVSRPRGFALIEVLVVVAIIAVLAAVALPQYSQHIRKPAPPILRGADQALDKLAWQGMAYSVPPRMEIGATADVTVLLGGNRTVDELVALLEAAGQAEGQNVLFSNRMEAKLSGRGFEIAASTPEVQIVSTRQVTTWRWQVTAKELGAQKLLLSLNALLNLGGKETAKSVKTFEREITVEVTSVSGAVAFLERYWAILGVLLTAIVVPLLVYLRKRFSGGATKDGE